MIENIKTIFTSEDMAEIKAAMKQIIVEQFDDKLNELSK